MTRALDDAAGRVSRYILLQFLVNASFGALFGIAIALSLAVFDGWLKPLLVFLLVASLELIIANFVEPWLYGAHVGTWEMSLALYRESRIRLRC
jgi:predicted PurR-regulated permease PerM